MSLDVATNIALSDPNADPSLLEEGGEEEGEYSNSNETLEQ